MSVYEHDVIVVGAGAGGASVASELARRNLKVALLERGGRYRRRGRFWSSLEVYDVHPVTKMPTTSREGIPVWRSFNTGGTTEVACGNAVRAGVTELAAEGLDISLELAEAEQELGVVRSERLISETSRQIIETAGKLGHRFELMPKLIDPDRCQMCGLCIWGCPHGAKWSAARTVKVACDHGARLDLGVEVEQVLISGGAACGVRGRAGGQPFEMKAGKVILAAGGLATPAILRRSGVERAGQKLFIDPFINTYGTIKGLDLAHEPSMAIACTQHHESDGFLLSPFAAHSRVLRFVESGIRGFIAPKSGYVGLMAKIKDDSEGAVLPDGSYSKTLTSADRAKLEAGRNLATEILRAMGASRRSLFSSKIGAAHPGGGAAIGDIVDERLETSISNLHVCDCSVLPRSPGLPPILSLIAIGRRLSKILAAT